MPNGHLWVCDIKGSERMDGWMLSGLMKYLFHPAGEKGMISNMTEHYVIN